jgi:hypothetical protein
MENNMCIWVTKEFIDKVDEIQSDIGQPGIQKFIVHNIVELYKKNEYVRVRNDPKDFYKKRNALTILNKRSAKSAKLIKESKLKVRVLLK